jgi:GT2 family glycosyltransferase
MVFNCQESKKMNFVIVVNYNNKKDSINCLRTLNKISGIKIILVDNNSSDNSTFEISKLFPMVVLIKNSKNYGFAKGNNIGIKYALKKHAEKILLLNNDTVFSVGSIEKMFQSVGDIVGAVLEFERDGRVYYDLGGHVNYWLGRAYHKEVELKKFVKKKEVDYVSGAAMLVQKKVFESIGLFDESYFLYYEDTDFCLRAARAGFKITLEPLVTIKHRLGSTLGRKSKFTLYHNLRSNLIFIIKNIPWHKKPIALLYWATLSVKVILNLIFR